MRSRQAPRLALAAALGLATVAAATPASAFFSYPTPADPGKYDVLTWMLVSAFAGGAATPQILAVSPLIGGPHQFSRGAAVGLAVLGGALGIADVIGLGFVPADDNAAALTLLGGPLWSMFGVGLGRAVNDGTHAPWLGGSMGFTTFAVIRGAMAQGGLADTQASAVIQSVHAAIGGAGCIGDALRTGSAERWVGIGCGVVSGVAFVHGIVLAARGDVAAQRKAHQRPKRRRPAALPMPWIERTGGGISVAGTF
jgi:hypothetical protein